MVEEVKSHANKIKDSDLVIAHIKSFKPNISHYRRSHAPQRLYLPSDLSVQKLYNYFNSKHPNTCPYEYYRKAIWSLNISFVQLGHEECEFCEHFKFHGHSEDTIQADCEECNIWIKHKEAAINAREEYDKDVKKQGEEDCFIYSVDLQKVIMLPRCDMFKNVIFIKRLTTYNESFVPVGKSTSNIRTAAAIWHEAISGRKKEDIDNQISGLVNKQ
ncbi:unnamed protein product [Psylliodes chrysocephalus]|uniref:Uncharacterized protein n=1 Tax=Psylliodes chrysocephalus TaxID=3402493 RepID=A0A9P0G2F6_9CUCU|nr:unnamed protein product [Psylliodes chrysocephala]